ncbi:MAG: enoyl-CoA hydratase/isomerase family protein [Chloroflexi bacterium]|nr:enoyl-CoA hydratase/isomerase family protein [Chloroflexota bacterium]
MQYDNILLDTRDGVATITLNRPAKLNAYTVEMGDEFMDALARVRDDQRARVLVITAAGRAFCAGIDIEDAAAARKSGYTEWHEKVIRFVATAPGVMTEMDKPIVAAVNGAAVGLGATLALACDIRIAADVARFALPFGRVGLAPEFGSTFTLPRIVGLGRALELVLTNKTINASEAKSIGLVNEVVPAGELAQAVTNVTAGMAKGSYMAMRLAKQGLYRGSAGSLEGQLAWEREALRACFGSTDHEEGLNAFLEKREPKFSAK